jgi:DNA-binding LacI/PurR family transcriptional regulator
LNELADEFDVARGTVRWAVKDLVSEGFLISRPGSGVYVSTDFNDDQLRQRYGTTPRSRGDRSILSGRNLELIYKEDPAETFTRRIIDAFKHKVDQLGGAIIKDRPLDYYAHKFDRRDSDAEILVCFQLDGEVICREDQTVILASPSCEGSVYRALGHDLISVDQEQGGAVAATILKQAGHTSACFIGATVGARNGQPYGPTSTARLAGFLHDWGQAETTVHCLHTDYYDITYGAAVVPQYLKLDPRPTAVFAASDELAIGFIAGMLGHDLKAGRDYSIVGFDGQDIARTMPKGPLTTVEVPATLLGQRAAKLLVERLHHPHLPPQRVFLGCSLLQGKTIMPPVQR